jgi:hypothetical protein
VDIFEAKRNTIERCFTEPAGEESTGFFYARNSRGDGGWGGEQPKEEMDQPSNKGLKSKESDESGLGSAKMNPVNN